MSRKIMMKQCPLSRGPKFLNVGRDIEFCDPDNQRWCMGQIRLCRNSDALRKHYIKIGLGWKQWKRLSKKEKE